MSNIATTVQNMKNDEGQARYFFSKAHSYQKLHLWIDPLFNAEFLSLNENNEFQYWNILEFLEKVSIQNKESEKTEITQRLLSIANQTIKQATNDHIVWYMIKVIFNLPVKDITLEHIDFISSYVKNCKHRSILNHDITKTVMPVLIENEMREHMLKLLPLIFGYELKKDTLSHVEPISIIEEYNLLELLKRHSKDMIELVGLDGLKIVVNLIKEITAQEKSIFNPVWLTVIRTKTDDEIKQNRHSDRYDNQLIFFTRDLFENIPSAETKPYIEDFLLKQQHPVFIRLALHVINCKYSNLKDIFWQWMNTDVKYKGKELELWTLLKESSESFVSDEFDKIIDWVEASNCRKYRPDDSDEIIKSCNAYRRKEWLLCLKNNNKRAENLYQKYHLINDIEVEHPGFSYWSSGIYTVPEYSYPNQKEFCSNPVDRIIKFDPSTVKNKGNLYTNEDLKRGLANDLSTCIKNNPATFVEKINDFESLEYIYKSKVIQGFVNAWNDKQKFDWKKVFDFIENELSPEFFSSDENHKQWFVSEIASLIECGTKEDNNAFNKELLPKAKEILFILLDNKYEEKESDNMVSHVLNSTNGEVLHAIINYALRYGRLNSSQSIKWEGEVKDFFTRQLEENNLYSRSLFTVLGTYFHNLQFLDKNWVTDNFNKIFPLKNKQLWKDSIKAYFFHTSTVYEETYNLFKDNGHIEEILLFDFKEDGIESRLVSFVCIAYINDTDNDTIFDIINSKNTGNILRIIHSMLQVYRDEEEEEIKRKIQIIWNNIYETYKSDDTENAKKIFNELCDWFVFLDEIHNEDMELLKYTVRYDKDHYQMCNLLTEMARLSVNYPQEISKIYKHMINNNIYPTYKKEDIKQIFDNLDNDDDELEIRNHYLQEGYTDIAEL